MITPALTYSSSPAPWNKAQHATTRMPTAPCGGRGVSCGARRGVGYNNHPGTTCHPSAEGNFSPQRYVPVPLHWRGGRSPGWSERSRTHTYAPLSSRAKRDDPVNKKALRAFARRHIALDCHSRTTTFSTLIVLLRNDRGICRRSRFFICLLEIVFVCFSCDQGTCYGR